MEAAAKWRISEVFRWGAVALRADAVSAGRAGVRGHVPERGRALTRAQGRGRQALASCVPAATAVRVRGWRARVDLLADRHSQRGWFCERVQHLLCWWLRRQWIHQRRQSSAAGGCVVRNHFVLGWRPEADQRRGGFAVRTSLGFERAADGPARPHLCARRGARHGMVCQSQKATAAARSCDRRVVPGMAGVVPGDQPQQHLHRLELSDEDRCRQRRRHRRQQQRVHLRQRQRVEREGAQPLLLVTPLSRAGDGATDSERYLAHEISGLRRAGVAGERRHRGRLRLNPRLGRRARFRARHHCRPVGRGVVVRGADHGAAGLGLRESMEERGAAWRPMGKRVCDDLSALDLSRNADGRSGHLSHDHAFGAVLAELALGS